MRPIHENWVDTSGTPVTTILTIRRFIYLAALVTALAVRACIGAGLIRAKVRRGDLQVFLARTIVRTVERMGPAATKLAQIASARNDIFPQRFCAALSTIQDQVRPPSKSELDTVRTVLARKLDLHIAADPIAAGSIAVVLKATTREGLTLALKVVRPGVRRCLQADLAVIRCLLKPIVRLAGVAHLAIVETFDELSETVLVQTDMNVELQHTETALRLLADQPIAIPRPHPEYSDADVLALDYCPADCNILDPSLSRAAYEKALRSMAETTFFMIFVHGFIHCDLHPGNVGVSASGRPIVYDFGLSAIMEDSERRHFRDFYLAIATSDKARAASSLLVSAKSTPGPCFDAMSFETDLGSVLARTRRTGAGNTSVLGLVKDVLDLQRRHRIMVSSAFVKAVWALVTLEGLLRSRHAQIDFQKLAILVIRKSHAKDAARLDDRSRAYVASGRESRPLG